MLSTLCMHKRRFLTVLLLLFTFTLLTAGSLHSEESSCIACHTDEDLLEENLGKEEKKKSALQAGSG